MKSCSRTTKGTGARSARAGQIPHSVARLPGLHVVIRDDPPAARDIWRQNADRLPVAETKRVLTIFAGSTVEGFEIVEKSNGA